LSLIAARFSSSEVMEFLSSAVRDGAWRMDWRRTSFLKTEERFSSALAVLSRVEFLAAAVYCYALAIDGPEN